MKVTLRGRWVRIVERQLRNAMGTYEPGVITLHGTLQGVSRLDTLLHEALHHCLPDFDEAAVDEIAGDLAAMLWAQDYRRQKVANG
jgi:hypothetical protein